jgi:hypothetical protein
VTRAILRFATWRITPDHAQDAPVTYQMECTTCAALYGTDDAAARSPASEDDADGQLWALHHSGRHPSHTSYGEHITRFWRTAMVDGTDDGAGPAFTGRRDAPPITPTGDDTQ